jgi:hypothetical protein
MEKVVHVLWKREDLSEEAFKEEMLGSIASRFLDLGTRKLSVNLVDESVAHTKGVRLTRQDPPIAGMISFWLDMADERAPYEEALARVTSRYAGYLVVESVPIVNREHLAKPGERTPGINVVACIEKPDRLTQEAWITHWFGHHKGVAIETQCTFSYVRNLVVHPLTQGAPPWAGIVEEGFPTEAVTDPMLWYCGDGSEEKMQRNMARMMESVQAFLDIDRVESNPMSEYRIKEPA